MHYVTAMLWAVSSLMTTVAGAQDYTLLPESRIWIEGASNRHDWEAKVSEMTGTVRVKAATPVPLVEAARITIPSEKVESTRETWHERRIMNGLIHRALKTDEHPQIRYELGAVDSVAATGEGAFVVYTRGTLTLAGVSNEIGVAVEGTKREDGVVQFSGSHTLSMRAYGITPPRVKLPGMTLTTQDEATVHFDLRVGPGS